MQKLYKKTTKPVHFSTQGRDFNSNYTGKVRCDKKCENYFPPGRLIGK